MAKRNRKGVKQNEDDSKLFAFLAVFLSVLGFIIALLVKKENKYVMYYTKQSLILFIAFVIAGIIGWIPVIGWIVWLFVFVLWIIGLVYSLSGEEKPIFIIGELSKKINL